MDLFNKKHVIPLLFCAVGSSLGYLYYLKIGCVTGTCSITSNPWLSTLYGAVFGFLIAMLLPCKKEMLADIKDKDNTINIDRKGD